MADGLPRAPGRTRWANRHRATGTVANSGGWAAVIRHGFHVAWIEPRAPFTPEELEPRMIEFLDLIEQGNAD